MNQHGSVSETLAQHWIANRSQALFVFRHGISPSVRQTASPSAWVEVIENSGGPVATRTPDLYRVKVAL